MLPGGNGGVAGEGPAEGEHKAENVRALNALAVTARGRLPPLATEGYV